MTTLSVTGSLLDYSHVKDLVSSEKYSPCQPLMVEMSQKQGHGKLDACPFSPQLLCIFCTISFYNICTLLSWSLEQAARNSVFSHSFVAKQVFFPGQPATKLLATMAKYENLLGISLTKRSNNRLTKPTR